MIRFVLLLGTLVALNFSAVFATPIEDEARAVFKSSLQAIADQDSDAYLACYWSDLFEAEGLEAFSLGSGVVYGQYRYHVRFGESESYGVSERLFLLTDEGWRIAVTTAFAAPEDAMNPSPTDEPDQ